MLIWIDDAASRIGPRTRELLTATPDVEIMAVSAITFWETAYLVRKGRINLPMLIQDWRKDLLLNGLQEIPLDGATAMVSVNLDLPTRDPADRIIVATARQYDLALVTADRQILDWDGRMERIDARQ